MTNLNQIEELKNKPEFEVLRKILITTMNGNMLRLKHTSYFSDETRQVIQKLESAGYKIIQVGDK
jgi:hypothetical protein